MCTHIITEPSIILHIIDATENLARSAKFRYETINAGSKINAPPSRPYEKISAAGVYFRKYGTSVCE